MASKKDLKKDIHYLVDEVVGTCLLRQSMDEKLSEEAADKLIMEMLDYRDTMIDKVNNPPGENREGKALKSYYRSLRSELLEKVNEAFDKIHEQAE